MDGTARRAHRTGLRGRWLRLALAAAVALTAATLAGTPANAATLSPGFAVVDLPSGQAETLTDFAFAPDGSWFTIGKNGRVAWVSAAGEPRTLATLPVVTVQDLGLTGLAVAPDYATSHKIYLARTMKVDGVRTMRLGAVTRQGDPQATYPAPQRVV